MLLNDWPLVEVGLPPLVARTKISLTKSGFNPLSEMKDRNDILLLLECKKIFLTGLN